MLQKYIHIKKNLRIGGDFNMVEDLTVDRQGSTPNNTYLLSIQHLRQIKEK